MSHLMHPAPVVVQLAHAVTSRPTCSRMKPPLFPMSSRYARRHLPRGTTWIRKSCCWKGRSNRQRFRPNALPTQRADSAPARNAVSSTSSRHIRSCNGELQAGAAQAVPPVSVSAAHSAIEARNADFIPPATSRIYARPARGKSPTAFWMIRAPCSSRNARNAAGIGARRLSRR